MGDTPYSKATFPASSAPVTAALIKAISYEVALLYGLERPDLCAQSGAYCLNSHTEQKYLAVMYEFDGQRQVGA